MKSILRTLLFLSAVSFSFSAWAEALPAGMVESIDPPPMSVPSASEIRIAGKIVNVVDGDTLDVVFMVRVAFEGEWSGEPKHVALVPIVARFRLLADVDGRGCWAPESRTKDATEKKKGLEAKAHLAAVALGKPCRVVVPIHSQRLIDHLTLERFLAVVEVDGKSLGQTQVESKLASSTKGGKLGK